MLAAKTYPGIIISLFILLFSYSVPLYSQSKGVKIVDTVKISPHAAPPSNSPALSTNPYSTLEFVILWMQDVDPVYLGGYTSTGRNIGFSPYSGCANDSCFLEYDSSRTHLVIKDPPSGTYVLSVYSDTAMGASHRYVQHVEVYLNGTFAELIDMSHEWIGTVPGTTYGVSGSAYYTIPCSIPGTPHLVTDPLSEVTFPIETEFKLFYENDCGVFYDPGNGIARIEIVDGTRWGFLYDLATDKSGNVLDSVAFTDGAALFYFLPWKEEPLEPQTVTLRFAVSFDGYIPVTRQYTVKPYPFPLSVFSNRSTVECGDTTVIKFQMKNSDQTPVLTLPQSSSFFIALGDTLSYLYSPDSVQTGAIVEGALDSAMLYMLPRETAPDSAVVTILVRADEECPDCGATRISPGTGLTAAPGVSFAAMRRMTKGEREKKLFEQRKNMSLRKGIDKKGSVQRSVASTAATHTASLYGITHFGVVNVAVKPPFTILLGETKYYYVVQKDDNLIIHETPNPTMPTSGMDGTLITNASVWGTDPLTVIKDKNNSGKRLGVYWERKYPVYTGNDFTRMDSLPAGMIRLIGRYWHADSIYKVNLTANYSSKSGSITVTVKKPDSLGTIHNREKDVKGNEYNLDDIIITYAGKYGIPPQFIKGDIQMESNNFNPSYRWEPFYDAWHIQKNAGEEGTSIYFTNDFQYKIDNLGNEGDPPIPTDHSNLWDGAGRILSYPGYVGTIWEEFYRYADTVNPTATKNLYPQRNAHGDTVWYKTPVKIWNEKFGDIKKKLKSNRNLTETQKNDSARNTANYWLRYQWLEGIMNTGIAQTRSASSYGLLQIMYTSAHEDRKYLIDDDHLPEFLNITDTNFNNAVPFMLMKLNSELKSFSNKGNNWDKGYELIFLRAYDRYNGATEETGNIGKKGYGKGVLKYSRSYLPKKK